MKFLSHSRSPLLSFFILSHYSHSLSSSLPFLLFLSISCVFFFSNSLFLVHNLSRSPSFLSIVISSSLLFLHFLTLIRSFLSESPFLSSVLLLFPNVSIAISVSLQMLHLLLPIYSVKHFLSLKFSLTHTLSLRVPICHYFHNSLLLPQPLAHSSNSSFFFVPYLSFHLPLVPCQFLYRPHSSNSIHTPLNLSLHGLSSPSVLLTLNHQLSLYFSCLCPLSFPLFLAPPLCPDFSPSSQISQNSLTISLHT